MWVHSTRLGQSFEVGMYDGWATLLFDLYGLVLQIF